ncbi:DUF5658 family protein [Desulfosporosinus hippei]|uniref:DUF5658 family protein n=1 Tax=Desulfosporosinus hippei TaxID=569859 RepID=UPI000B81DC72
MLFCALNIIDYYTTIFAISHGAIEGNPLAGYFVDRNALHYFKFVGVTFLCIYLIHASKRNRKSQKRVIRVLWGVNLAYSVLAIYNVTACFIQKYDFALR